MKKAKMRDVALAAGVSPASVSNYFNRPELLTGQTRTLIEGAIRDLGYVRNETARSLRLGTSSTVGYVTFELRNALSVDIGSELEIAASRQGMRLLTANSAGSTSRERDYLELFESQGVSGIIVAPNSDIEDSLLEMRRRGTPSVVSGRIAQSDSLASVSVEDVDGGYLAAHHLLSIGRRRLAFVGGTLNLRQISDRLQGASMAVSEVSGASMEVISVPERTVTDGRRIGQLLAERSPLQRPDGVFAANDMLAIGVLQALVLDGGVAVPEDIAVVGYDDVDFAESALVPLTSIRSPYDLLAQALFDSLMEEINELASKTKNEGREKHIVFEPELVVRASTQS